MHVLAIHLPTTTGLELIVLLGAAVAAIAMMWTRFIGPFIGRPIGKAIRAELEELVEQIVVRLNNELLRRIGEHERRLSQNETHIDRIDNRLQLLEADQSSLTLRFRSHFGTHQHHEEDE